MAGYEGGKIPLAAILGPTASGKTALAVELAGYFSGEIVSCDSMQVYRGLEIGTAKPKKAELEKVPHHMIGVVDLEKSFSVADYTGLASRAIEDIYSRGRLPFLVGGTGLYARALIRGADFSGFAGDEGIRRRLLCEAEGDAGKGLYKRLCELDMEAARAIHPNNLKRVVRALEYIELSGEKFSQKSSAGAPGYNFIMLCLCFREREGLYERIGRRVDEMFAEGLVEEAWGFFRRLPQGGCTAAQAIGYKELFPYFRGEVKLEEARENIKRETRRYAKRQMTWFRKESGAVTIYADDYSREGLLCECRRIIEASGIIKHGGR